MKLDIVKKIFDLNLDKLKQEIESYHDEANLWALRGDVKNCAGNLCLHLVGNLNHFIGAGLGNTGYVRQRDKEFSDKDVPRAELVAMVEATKEMLQEVLSNLNDDVLDETFPNSPFGHEVTIGYFLAHLTNHLTYHLGQINYHRRLIEY